MRPVKGKSGAVVNAIAGRIAGIRQSRKRALPLAGKDMALLPAIIEL